MIYKTIAFLTALMVSSVSGKVYFQESFGTGWEDRWVQSTAKPAEQMGSWKHTAGIWNGDAADLGIQTSQDARHYALTSKLNEAFTNKDKDMVLQFSVKHEQQIDCGGAYIKLMGDTDQAKFDGNSPYQIMFGPDICGPSNRKTHVIFNYPPKNDNLLIKEEVKVETDQLTHLYTLIVRPDSSFEVLIDQESVRVGNLEDSFDFLLPKEIKDPSISKPADWVDTKKIADPTDTKPAGYDDVPAEIPDPEAQKPSDWDDEEDGDWEPPLVDNPEYNGPWSPKMIPNPDYVGEWVHPLIPNPDYHQDAELSVRCKDCTHIGFELWQVKSGTIFDDIIVTDSIEEANEYGSKTMAKMGPEKEAFEKIESEKREAEAAQREADMANQPPADEEEEEDHDEL